MTPRDHASSSTLRGRAAWIAALVAGIAILWPFDKSLYHAAVDFETRHHRDLRELLRLWRVAGFLPLWALLSGACWLIRRDRRRRGQSTGAALSPSVLLLPPLIAGTSAEILKLLVRRVRPSGTDGNYAFRSFLDGTFEFNGFGMPSSETAVAFAAGFTLYRAFPGAWPVWLFFATGCGVTRMLEGRHFASDVWVGALLGVACAQLVWQRSRRALEPSQASLQPPGTALARGVSRAKP